MIEYIGIDFFLQQPPLISFRVPLPSRLVWSSVHSLLHDLIVRQLFWYFCSRLLVRIYFPNRTVNFHAVHERTNDQPTIEEQQQKNGCPASFYFIITLPRTHPPSRRIVAGWGGFWLAGIYQKRYCTTSVNRIVYINCLIIRFTVHFMAGHTATSYSISFATLSFTALIMWLLLFKGGGEDGWCWT